MGIPPTGKKVIINVIDIIRLREGKYVEHWGMSNIPEVIAQLSFS
jgi:predicted ester cyclase